MESYELVFKKSVAKDLRSIPKKDISRILKRIKVVREDPRGQGCVKLSVQERYRARQGVYRARMAPLRSPRPQRWSAHQHSPGLVCAHKHGAIEPATLAQPPECACAPRSKVCRTASVRAGLIGCSCPAAAARLQLPAYNCPPTTARLQLPAYNCNGPSQHNRRQGRGRHRVHRQHISRRPVR